MPEENRKTQFDIPEIVQRCFKELAEAGEDITIMKGNKPPEPLEYKVLINEPEVAAHISRTLIGELLEFEIIRKAAAVAREEKRIEADLQTVEAGYMRENALKGLRIDPGTVPEPPKTR